MVCVHVYLHDQQACKLVHLEPAYVNLDIFADASLGRLTGDMSEVLTTQLLQALKHLTQAKLVHCDIEPKHIRVHVTDSQQCGIMDFSLCRPTGVQLSADIKYADEFSLNVRTQIRFVHIIKNLAYVFYAPALTGCTRTPV
jgi:hypothetical protein